MNKKQAYWILAALLMIGMVLSACVAQSQSPTPTFDLPTPTPDQATAQTPAQDATAQTPQAGETAPSPEDEAEAAPTADTAETPTATDDTTTDDTTTDDTTTDDTTTDDTTTDETREEAETAEEPPAEVDAEALIEQGRQLYARNCAACHQLNGEGTHIYPALNNNEVVIADDPSEAINIVVHGREQMPPFGALLSPEEIAAVLSYIRNAWDNEASIVTAGQVEQAAQSGSN